jgi:hypothetical protein
MYKSIALGKEKGDRTFGFGMAMGGRSQFTQTNFSTL